MNRRSTTDYAEATCLKIIRPQTAAKGKVFDMWITATSPAWQRVAVVQLTRYLSLETGYKQDLVESSASWVENKTAVFAITDDITGNDGQERQGLVGIMTFHQFPLQKSPVLYQCYLHPFFRGKGRMQKAWTKVQLKYPAFEIEPPLSAAMGRFLTKVDCSPVLPSI